MTDSAILELVFDMYVDGLKRPSIMVTLMLPNVSCTVRFVATWHELLQPVAAQVLVFRTRSDFVCPA